MLTQQRKQHILAVLRRDGHVIAKELSAQLELSEDTIRRDLRELAQEGLLQRVHGGALPASRGEVDFASRQTVATEEKAAIGRAAAKLVENGQVLFIDGGTTAVQLVRHLDPDLRATVVTHSPSVAVELVAHAGIEVVLIGGQLLKHSVVTIGAAAVEGISRVRADTYFMGAAGVHPSVGLTTGHAEEAAIKRALMAAAGETVVLASSEKLGTASTYLVAPVQAASTLVVSVPKAVTAPFRKLGLSIVQA